MSEVESGIFCPACGNTGRFLVERSPDGYTTCTKCSYRDSHYKFPIFSKEATEETLKAKLTAAERKIKALESELEEMCLEFNTISESLAEANKELDERSSPPNPADADMYYIPVFKQANEPQLWSNGFLYKKEELPTSVDSYTGFIKVELFKK